jgi:hypothetical protein
VNYQFKPTGKDIQTRNGSNAGCAGLRFRFSKTTNILRTLSIEVGGSVEDGLRFYRK